MAKNENPNNAEMALVQKEQNTPSLVFDNIEHFENAQRMCKCLSTAGMLPAHFRGDENIGNCMIALEIAQRGQLPVMEVFQNLIIVQGRVSWFASHLIGRVNACGKYSTLTWESEHENTEQWRMRARAVELTTGEVLVGSWVSLKMANDEHWGGKWKTMPEQMLRYRSAAFWVRAYCPNIAMGIKDQYETEDAIAEIVAAEPANVPTEEKKRKAKQALKDALTKKENAEEAQVVDENPQNKPSDAPETGAQANAPEAPANAAEQPANGQPKPIVKVVVEPTAGAQPAQPRNPYLEKALQNMGLKNPQSGTQTEIPTDENNQ